MFDRNLVGIDVLIEEINAVLPQIQCRQCGFAGCKPYAVAITKGLADINQCPPGDEEGVQKLAKIMGVKQKSLNTFYGKSKPRLIAQIDEQICIGCTFCIQACPVDAIIGATKQMHTVISLECTGCELCIAPCPIDCITMIPPKKEINNMQHDPYRVNHTSSLGTNVEKKKAADYAKKRYEFRLQRMNHTKID